MKTSKFKVQTSNKLQSSNFKTFWSMMFVISLVFGVWCLNFANEGGTL